ncbi:MAG: pantoate--beta-alanine ligase [Chitinophagaceae bacterium]|nr:pantoate--beta-alanine ligase [Chitinophagaceae bacterium]
MLLFKNIHHIQEYLQKQRASGKSYGFIPTMGALHRGHISLIEASKKENDFTVSSIFVNPTQFNDPLDFEKYPVTIEKDIQLLLQVKCDVLFLPTVNEIYPDGLQTDKNYNLGHLETVLEGKYRPGHFQGVCRVVHRLLDIIKPPVIYLGQKDYQQCMVIKKLTELSGIATGIKICPTLREESGLAMSSRNMRLNEAGKQKASAIYNTLLFLKNNIKKGPLAAIKEEAHAMLAEAAFKTDYIEIADAATLEIQHEWNGKTKIVALAAAFLNDVRLIDNLLLN